MKRFLKLVGALVGLFAAALGGFLLFVQIDGIPKYKVEKIDVQIVPTPERVARGSPRSFAPAATRIRRQASSPAST